MRLILILIIAVIPRASFALSVEEAYQAIPHQRTVFESKQAKMAEPVAGALQRLFELVDQAIVLRVESAKDFSPGVRKRYLEHLRLLREFSPPPELKDVHA